MSKQFYENLRSQLKNHKQSLPEGLWNEIEADLPPRASVASGAVWHRYRRWAWSGAAVAAMIIIAVLFFVQQPLDKPQLSETKTSIIKVAKPQHEKQHNVISDQIAAVVPQTMAQQHMAVSNLKTSADVVEQNQQASLPEEMVAPENNEADVANKDVAENSDESTTQVLPPATKAVKQQQVNVSAKKEKTENHFSAELFASGIPMPQRKSGLDVNSDPGPALPPPVLAELNPIKPQIKVYNATHKLPIKVGAIVAYHIGKRWSVISGVNFMQLSSEIFERDEFWNRNYTQTLRYVGIPLGANFSFYSNRWVNIYATATVNFDLCVSSTNSKGDKLPHPFQFSTTIAPGAQVRFTRNIGVFVEPGLSYSFDDGTTLLSRFKAYPLDFQLKMGVRFDFK